MGVSALAPNIVSRFEGQEGGGEVRFHKGYSPSVFEEAHHRPIFSIRFPSMCREANSDVKAFDLYRILERDGDACQRALQVALFGRPFFSFGEENLGCTVSLFVCLDCDFAIGAEDVDGVSDILLDILDKLLDGFAKNRALLWSQRIAIGCWEVRDLSCALVLLALTDQY